MAEGGREAEDKLVVKRGATSTIWNWFGYRISDEQQTTVQKRNELRERATVRERDRVCLRERKCASETKFVCARERPSVSVRAKVRE